MDRRWLAAGALVVALGACAKEQPAGGRGAGGPRQGHEGVEDRGRDERGAGGDRQRRDHHGLAVHARTASRRQLKAGTNGWTCLPDDPSTPSDDPVCGDSLSFAWYGQYMQHKIPHTTTVALAYMLQGASDASNTDPSKMKPDSGQEWVTTGPHVMIFVPDPKALRGHADRLEERRSLRDVAGHAVRAPDDPGGGREAGWDERDVG